MCIVLDKKLNRQAHGKHMLEANSQLQGKDGVVQSTWIALETCTETTRKDLKRWICTHTVVCVANLSAYVMKV